MGASSSCFSSKQKSQESKLQRQYSEHTQQNMSENRRIQKYIEQQNNERLHSLILEKLQECEQKQKQKEIIVKQKKLNTSNQNKRIKDILTEYNSYGDLDRHNTQRTSLNSQNSIK